ncbi:hypothetical protein SNOG_05156 [Parastagonospora nodorum SN15]|uniref:Uncharacterized protein n=1 Tax=Phaeosphaeria nodorum (strain SN15 / ATCC MYA-4574 / FGSC 10173) TaxID=321614 RepID=Q0USV8_PHANO|nr:hypothetical protein SNOG_05156 [Parastagonospora nodorum SN15]EAT87547.1 hypothetical protein SNOG_05156 [Parastagonospora nodorum SN15]
MSSPNRPTSQDPPPVPTSSSFAFASFLIHSGARAPVIGCSVELARGLKDGMVLARRLTVHYA